MILLNSIGLQAWVTPPGPIHKTFYKSFKISFFYSSNFGNILVARSISLGSLRKLKWFLGICQLQMIINWQLSFYQFPWVLLYRLNVSKNSGGAPPHFLANKLYHWGRAENVVLKMVTMSWPHSSTHCRTLLGYWCPCV
jgi:hypothetical protein